MERRFLTFMVLAVLILVVHGLVTNVLFPPKPKPKEKAGQGQVAQQDQAKPAPVKPVDPAVPAVNPAVPGETPAVPPNPARWISLGSMDPKSPYRLLVTLTSKGAALERVELNDPQFIQLDDLSARRLGGYLANFHLTPVSGGCRVEVVGAGTPAEQAGVLVGDVITAVNGTKTANLLAYRGLLEKTEPFQTVTLEVLRGDKPVELKATLKRWPLQFMQTDSNPVMHGQVDPPSMLLSLHQIDKQEMDIKDEKELPGVDLYDSEWKVLPSNDPQTEVTFSRTLPTLGLEVLKHYRLEQIGKTADGQPRLGYAINFEIEIRNTGTQARELAYRLKGPNGLTADGWWFMAKIHNYYFNPTGPRDVAFRYSDESGPLIIDPSTIARQTEPKHETGRPIQYLGVDTSYFAAILLPQKKLPTDNWFTWARAMPVGPVPPNLPQLTNVTVEMASIMHKVEPGASFVDKYQMFAGPKDAHKILAYYGPASTGGLTELVQLGWFAPLVSMLSWYLHVVFGFIGNYGIAIILLTVTVRLLIFPLSRWSSLHMQAQQEKLMRAQPELKAADVKFKNDSQALMAAKNEIFRKYDINPVAMAGGCFTLFLQIPIFAALFNALRTDVALWQQPLIPGITWASNLSAPDMLFYWQPYLFDMLAGPTGWMGPYFNVLPIISTGLMYFLQKRMMPPPQDEQQEMQHQMMGFMTIFFGVLFFKFPAGLCLYFITSSLWGMAERKVLKLGHPKPGSVDPIVVQPIDSTKAAAPATNSGGLLASLLGTNGKQEPEQTAAERKANRKKRQRDRN